MKIYTKTGDKGTTRLVDGSCVEKFNMRVEAYGTVDELNSYIGVIRSELDRLAGHNIKFSEINKQLYAVQHKLFVVGSLLATEKIETIKVLPQLRNTDSPWLENLIDQMTNELPTLKNFILPAGHGLSSQIHFARTLCRRAERRAAEVAHGVEHYSDILIYLNRLSDYFFTLARYINLITETAEVLWNKDE